MTNETTDAQLNRPVTQLAAAIDVFREVTSTMSLAQLKAFLVVATNEGKSLGELTLIAGGKTSTMSRYLLDFSDKVKNGGDGYGLISRTSDPAELRRNVYSLTPRGRAMMDKVLKILGTGK
ncbi:MarR family transcriptional regulator [Sphingomonas paeninsulae]|uniref:MarR family transcriptional regulator n=1 Tax=Sphingomonas paeninsulae TaxID=2319844 RepID=A0A494T8A1_SPHPE|nr:MarR family winged helix-turn-helix transcriptional regulator [Sphingomonas paeninsulae]AYJ85547.1 MarR family transcriptional regulator [Sphingomonas paeninsulae]